MGPRPHSSIVADRDEAPFNDHGIRWQVVAWVLGVVVSIVLTYNATSNNFDRRLSVLESQRDDMERRTQRIEMKIDQLLERRP